MASKLNIKYFYRYKIIREHLSKVSLHPKILSTKIRIVENIVK